MTNIISNSKAIVNVSMLYKSNEQDNRTTEQVNNFTLYSAECRLCTDSTEHCTTSLNINKTFPGEKRHQKLIVQLLQHKLTNIIFWAIQRQ